MTKKVVLVCLPFFNHLFTPPIQLAYLKAYLRQNRELEVKILDLESLYFHSPIIKGDTELYTEKTVWGERCISEESTQALDAMADLILREKPNIVGFSVTHPNCLFTDYVAQRLKQTDPGIYIVYGGVYFSYRKPYLTQIAHWHRDRFPYVDCVVKNEGEAALKEIADALAEGKRPEYCAGTTLRFKNDVIDCGERPLIPDINNIPFPDFGDFSKNDYLGDYIRILISRGCIGRCAFCTDNYMGCVRLRRPENVVQEIELRIQQGYRRFQSCDLILNPSTSHLERLCELIILRNLRIEFVFGQLRHSPDLSRKTFALLKKTGFHTVCFGTESGSQKVLNMMRKDIDLNVAQQNIRDARSEGLDVILFFIVGFPGEDEHTFRESLEWVKVNAGYISAVKHVAPLCVNWSTAIHDDPESFNVDESSLFQNPDTWRTRDGANNRSWRMDLAARMIGHLNELGIPLVGFEGENPIVPETRKRLMRA